MIGENLYFIVTSYSKHLVALYILCIFLYILFLYILAFH